MKKVMSSFLLAGLILAQASGVVATVVDNTDGTQTITGEREASMEVVGKIGQFDPGTTDPDPEGPEPGEDAWIKVTLPTSVAYYSTGSSQHKEITSNEHKVVNESNYPVRVKLTGYTKDGTGQPDVTGIKNLSLGGISQPIPLVIDGLAQEFDSGQGAAGVFDLGAGGETPAAGEFTGPSTGTFKFSGETDSTGIDLSQQTVLDNTLHFTLSAMDGDGHVPKPELNADGTVSFANEKWSVIKNYGDGNYMIAMQRAVETDKFNTNGSFYTADQDSLDGYSNSNVKAIIDNWYDTTIKGTAYESSVLPVTLNNPTLGDMKGKYGNWTSNTVDNWVSGDFSGFLAMNQPDAFPTEVNGPGAKKQAFAMSGSDVSTGQGEWGELTPEVKKYAMVLLEKEVYAGVWLRTPHYRSSYASSFNTYYAPTEVTGVSLGNGIAATPTLVVSIP